MTGREQNCRVGVDDSVKNKNTKKETPFPSFSPHNLNRLYLQISGYSLSDNVLLICFVCLKFPFCERCQDMYLYIRAGLGLVQHLHTGRLKLLAEKSRLFGRRCAMNSYFLN